MGTLSKKISESVQKVKRKIYGQKMDFTSKSKDVEKHVEETIDKLSTLYKKGFPIDLYDIQTYIVRLKPDKKMKKEKFFAGISHLNAAIFSLKSLESVLNIVLKMNSFDRIHELKSGKSLLILFKIITKHLCSIGNKLSEIEQNQFPLEINRFCDIVNYFAIESSEEFRQRIHMQQLRNLHNQAEQLLYSTGQYSVAVQNQSQNILTSFEGVLQASLGLSREEKQAIMSAMAHEFNGSYKQGHWYECPNGHPYCITQCGGAMELSKCPECKAPIGGSRHRLTEGNRVATEFSGATQPAWPQ